MLDCSSKIVCSIFYLVFGDWEAVFLQAGQNIYELRTSCFSLTFYPIWVWQSNFPPPAHTEWAANLAHLIRNSHAHEDEDDEHHDHDHDHQLTDDEQHLDQLPFHVEGVGGLLGRIQRAVADHPVRLREMNAAEPQGMWHVTSQTKPRVTSQTKLLHVTC